VVSRRNDSVRCTGMRMPMWASPAQRFIQPTAVLSAATFIFTPMPARVYGRFSAAQQRQSGLFRAGRRRQQASRHVVAHLVDVIQDQPQPYRSNGRLHPYASQSLRPFLRSTTASIRAVSGGERGGSKPAGTLARIWRSFLAPGMTVVMAR
jgi:hypothetical protein